MSRARIIRRTCRRAASWNAGPRQPVGDRADQAVIAGGGPALGRRSRPRLGASSHPGVESGSLGRRRGQTCDRVWTMPGSPSTAPNFVSPELLLSAGSVDDHEVGLSEGERRRGSWSSAPSFDRCLRSSLTHGTANRYGLPPSSSASADSDRLAELPNERRASGESVRPIAARSR